MRRRQARQALVACLRPPCAAPGHTSGLELSLAAPLPPGSPAWVAAGGSPSGVNLERMLEAAVDWTALLASGRRGRGGVGG
jgi:hypothetical protein